MRGVAKGALTEDQANQMHEEWIAAKESKVEARREQTRLERENFWKQVSGEIKPKVSKKVDEATAAAFSEGGEAEAPAAEATDAPVAEAAAVEAEAPAAEAPVAEAAATEAVAEVKEEIKADAEEE